MLLCRKVRCSLISIASCEQEAKKQTALVSLNPQIGPQSQHNNVPTLFFALVDFKLAFAVTFAANTWPVEICTSS
jgi:hypothetical protein